MNTRCGEDTREINRGRSWEIQSFKSSVNDCLCKLSREALKMINADLSVNNQSQLCNGFYNMSRAYKTEACHPKVNHIPFFNI